MPNDPYSGRTAPLTSKRFILYIYSTNTGTEHFKHGIYSPFFPLQNAVCFTILTYLVPVLLTFYIQGVLKLKKNNSGAKRLTTVTNYIPFKNTSPRANRMLKGNYDVDIDIFYTKSFVRHHRTLHSNTCVSALPSHRQALKILHETITEINAIKMKIILS